MGFLFGSSSKLPNQKQKPLGADEHRLSTAEQARPVPYLAGKQRIGVTFITDVFGEKATAVTQTVGKQKAKSGYNYYASFAGLVCLGPVDALYDIFLNGDSVYASTTVIQILSLTRSGSTATAQTRNAHGLTTGDELLLEGALQLEYNGSFVITVTDSTHFTFTLPSGTPATPATGTITARVKLDPVLRDDAHPDYVDITIPDYGTMRLYWGTETQAADAYLQKSGKPHPGYRGLCYAVFNQLFLGFNQTNVQNVELTVSRRPRPASAWHDLAALEQDANPVAFITELLQHPRTGLALPDVKFNTSSLLATAATLTTEGLGFSPLLTRQQEARQVILSALEYVDGYPVVNAEQQLSLELARPAEDEPLLLTDDHMVERPQFTQEAWSEAFTTTYVKFTNRALGFKEDMPAPYRDPGLLAITGEPNIQTLDRPWVTRVEVARALCQSSGRAAALPALTGRVKLRQIGTLLADLRPGALFQFNHSARDLSHLWFRVTDRTLASPSRPEFEISFQLDRSAVFQAASE